MPKEKGSLVGMLLGLEPGPLARIKHDLSDVGEGEWGENSIATMLRNHVIGANVFQNVYVPVKGQDRTSEIDILMICPFGIFVIESKAFGGKIYGYENTQEWTQYLGGKESKFYNPIKQNENHCKYLAEALNISYRELISLIVFEDRADLTKVQDPVHSNVIICRRTSLHPILKALKRENGCLYSELDIKKLCRKIEPWCMAGKETVEHHIEVTQKIRAEIEEKRENFSSKAADRKSAEDDTICPICGRKLIMKTGSLGDFWSCSGYPECKFTKPTKETTCPRCGKALVKRKGPRGEFWGCMGYPSCHFMRQIEDMPEDSAQKNICPSCGKPLVLRKGPHSEFWGCTGYPDCHFVRKLDFTPEAKEAIQKNICPSCGRPLVLRKGPYSEFYGCSGYPDCRFTMPK